jgi:arsenate reductase
MQEVFEDWQLDDPDGQPIETFHRVRDEIKARVQKLIDTLN